jgi:carboxylesterase type B
MLRWAPTAPVKPWTDMLVADHFGAACPQECHLPPGACQNETEIHEDCLFLNVYSPAKSNSTATSATAGAALLPVMVWIHGGRFEQGSGGVELYDGSALAQYGPCLVVTINYRLGVLGFYVNNDEHINGTKQIQ